MTAYAYAAQPAARPAASVEPQPVVGAGFGYAPAGRRVAATLIDIAFVAMVTLAAFLLGGRSLPFTVVCAVQAMAVEWGWEAGRGRTVGKAIMGLRVVRAAADIDDAKAGLLPPGPWHALARTVTTVVASALAVVGAVAVEWTSSADPVRHRGIQDRFSGTSVIDARVRYVVPQSDSDGIGDNTGTDMADYDSDVNGNTSDGVSGRTGHGNVGVPAVSDEVVMGDAIDSILPVAASDRKAPVPQPFTSATAAAASVPPAAAPVVPSSSRPAAAGLPHDTGRSHDTRHSYGRGKPVGADGSGNAVSPRNAGRNATSIPTPHAAEGSRSSNRTATPPAARSASAPRTPAVPRVPASPAASRRAAAPRPPHRAAPSNAHPMPLPTAPSAAPVPSLPTPAAPTPGPPSPAAAVRTPPDMPSAGTAKQVAVIYFENGRGIHLDIPSRAVLGRKPASDDPNDVLVPVPDTTGTMSRSHALLEITAGRMWVTDLGSTNGSEVFGEDGATTRLAPHARTEIPFGTRVFLGNTAVSVSLLKNREKK
ncbi:RDD family protein [Bifidobacterium leontopitheci]|uniref:TransRDD family protein n=1 Tax=Bifidobacterium leontopitheci TaxID=2650774 RepID=A0A6I1GH39_9BIFI|nr:RDD family protein [Bifidobacterium leontopitheci]KAB7788996.1 transRDD family protein [Bifidobacterium leontopitheci]